MVPLNIKLGELNMINELKILKKKYDEIMLSPEKIENEYFQTVMSSYAYKKISKGPSINIRPFDFQQTGFKKGRDLKALPKVIDNTYVYYFDSENKILLTENYGKTENIIYREYYFYFDNRLELVYFDSGADEVIKVETIINKAKQPIYLIGYSRVSSYIWQYMYNDNKLFEIDVKCKEHNDTEFSYWKVDFEYESGELSKIIRRHPNGYEEQQYP
ncbi:hypothetical protein BGI32_06885 [Snodgrassella alvi]|uniref:Uncharacterized protein n=2 Tax=Snodgrassella alvi TaxID=1196083 RepID=A0A2N9WTG1_9NEIS|nr:hypothetical protein BGI32_06885 [Snodgrassella alvi]